MSNNFSPQSHALERFHILTKSFPIEGNNSCSNRDKIYIINNLKLVASDKGSRQKIKLRRLQELSPLAFIETRRGSQPWCHSGSVLTFRESPYFCSQDYFHFMAYVEFCKEDLVSATRTKFAIRPECFGIQARV